MKRICVLWIVCFILSTTHCSWLEDMERICGPVVDDLFYRDEDPAGEQEKCRLMRAAFTCIEEETNKSYPEDWKYLIDTQQIGNVSIRIANRCQKESLIFCPRYKINRRLQQCYNQTGVREMNWNCSIIYRFASQLNQTLDCMDKAIKRCPNDDFIKDDLASLGNWTQEITACSQKESLILCTRYNINRRLQQCYNQTGILYIDWTCTSILKHASQLNQTLNCMETEVKRCPSDNFIKDYLQEIATACSTGTTLQAGMSYLIQSTLLFLQPLLIRQFGLPHL